MSKHVKFVIAGLVFCFSAISSFGQAGFTPTVGWVDPALNHNRLIREQTADGVYKLVGTFKVIGTSYLFGERQKATCSLRKQKLTIFFSAITLITRKWSFIPPPTLISH